MNRRPENCEFHGKKHLRINVRRLILRNLFTFTLGDLNENGLGGSRKEKPFFTFFNASLCRKVLLTKFIFILA